MAPQVARAAATARERLISEAARMWSVDPTTLTARDGRIVAPDGRALSYGALARALTGTVTDAPVSGPERWGHRGTAAQKIDGAAFVTGRHPFTPDLVRPGMLHGRVIRPEGYTGTLASVDASRARALDGVQVVRDGDFLGVVAPNARALKRAAAAVRAEWRVAGEQPSSDTIYDHFKRTASRGGGGGRGAAPAVTGDVAAARAQAEHTFDATYRIPYIAHVPLEPHAAVAEWRDGRLTVWCGTQRPFGVRTQLAEAFHLPQDRVRVIVPDTGSAYGGKHTGEHAMEAARLARGVNRPVKVVWTREEEFSWGYLRPAGLIEIRAAVDAGGRITAWEFDNWNSGGAAIRTPYEIPNQRIAFHAADSPLRQGSYRGLAATANHHAREMHMDAIARALGADAVEFRLRHLKDERLRAVLTAAADRAGWAGRGSRAMGIACGTEKGSYVATVAEVSRTPDGFKVDRLVVTYECGAVVNPDGVRNQAEGAIVQGLGGALFEAIEFRNGAIVNGTMEQYRVPRFKDVPPMEIVILDRKDLPSAGAGETPIVCVAPAIGAAARVLGTVAMELPVRIA
jgi:isoquinoline 1-oxidoreductase